MYSLYHRLSLYGIIKASAWYDRLARHSDHQYLCSSLHLSAHQFPALTQYFVKDLLRDSLVSKPPYGTYAKPALTRRVQTINKVSVGVSIVPGGVYAGNGIAPTVRILVALSIPWVSAPLGNP